jgi:cation diffusion facilitator CzcD-associated flavoprotein CzcO
MDTDLVIVGAGVSGICMAIKAKEQGFTFVIVEAGASAGGTWHW